MSLLFVIQLQGLSGSVGSRDFDRKISYTTVKFVFIHYTYFDNLFITHILIIAVDTELP